MMPGLLLTVAAALGAGFSQIGAKLLDEGVIKPATQPAADQIKKLVGQGFEEAKNDAALQKAIATVFTNLGIPADGIDAYIYKLGFDRLQVKENSALREEIARAALLQVSPDVSLVPNTLIEALNLPYDSHPLLADFLYQLRRALHDHPQYGPLITYSREDAVQTYLRRLVDQMGQIAFYLKQMAQVQDITEQSEEEALKSYLELVSERYNTISFLFVEPATPRHRLKTQADLAMVFVPLQVQDPERDEPLRRGKGRRDELLLARSGEEGKQTLMTIDQVLNRYPVFLLRGIPGSGKTTLLRYLALTFARGRAQAECGWTGEPLLPILIPLRNFGRFWQDHRTEYTSPLPLALLRFIEDHFQEHGLTLPPNFFKERLQKGHCLVLFDGLDEVADRSLRAEVAQVVSKFIDLYSKNGNHFGLASRPRGYDEVARFLPRPVVCVVESMLPETRDRLVSNLLAQFEDRPARLRQETQKLLHEIRSKKQVDELSGNPLFCTTLVLVYKYQGAALPEKRVDVYQKLINLMLGFWDIHRWRSSDTTDVLDLALLTGTGRLFNNEDKAVEFKERALRHLADWMQENKLAEVAKTVTIDRLTTYFQEHDKARDAAEAQTWATGFLDVAHQRSGLFIEVDPETYAFSHQNFREYLAAAALIGRRDDQLIATILAHADDSWWEEVILLATAYYGPFEDRRQYMLEQLIQHDHLILAAKCALDAGDRLPHRMHQQVKRELYARMIDEKRSPQERYDAGLHLDALGWLPPDLNDWVRCPACADNRHDLYVQKYPVTNQQFALFIKAEGYDNPAWWGGENGEAWQWRLPGGYRGSEPVSEPALWQSDDFGKARRGFPVVGVSWYEAMAYAAWLTDLLRRVRAQDETVTAEERQLVEPLREAGGQIITLPTETEWVRLAGGDAADRYPWDKPGQPVTTDKAGITRRANVEEGGIGKTAPVAMYPQGASHPFALMDMAGNVLEWTNSWWDEKQQGQVLKGGSWVLDKTEARCAFRLRDHPGSGNYYFGFRLVLSPP